MDLSDSASRDLPISISARFGIESVMRRHLLQFLFKVLRATRSWLTDIKHTELIAAGLRSRRRYGLTNQAEMLQADQAHLESRPQGISAIGSDVVVDTELANRCGVKPHS